MRTERFNRNIVECKVSDELKALAVSAKDLIETSWNVKSRFAA